MLASNLGALDIDSPGADLAAAVTYSASICRAVNGRQSLPVAPGPRLLIVESPTVLPHVLLWLCNNPFYSSLVSRLKHRWGFSRQTRCSAALLVVEATGGTSYKNPDDLLFVRHSFPTQGGGRIQILIASHSEMVSRFNPNAE